MDECKPLLKGVSWHKHSRRWWAKCGAKSLGYHATEEAAARAYNAWAQHVGANLNVVPPAPVHLPPSRPPPSKIVLPAVHAESGSDTAARPPAAEEAAPRACNNYVKDGVGRSGAAAGCGGAAAAGARGGGGGGGGGGVRGGGGHVENGTRRCGSSAFAGVSWHKHSGKWWAKCGAKSLGYHATEEGAARAYNLEAERTLNPKPGWLGYNVIPPAGAADSGSGGNTAAPAALVFPSSVTPVRPHAAGGGSKRTAPGAQAGAYTRPLFRST